MMNRRTWIAGITATILLAASLAACKQEQQIGRASCRERV